MTNESNIYGLGNIFHLSLRCDLKVWYNCKRTSNTWNSRVLHSMYWESKQTQVKKQKKNTVLAYCWPCSDPMSWEIRESKHIVTPHLLSRGSRRVGHHDKDGRTPNTQWNVAAVVDDYHCKWTHNFYMHILKFSGTWRLSQSVRRTLYTQSDTNFSCFKQFIKYEGKKHRTPGKRRQQWNAKLSRQSLQNTWEG